MTLWILLGADVLVLIGLAIKLRNQSPYSNTPVDPQTRSRLRMARSVLLAGLVVGSIVNALRLWG